MSGLEVLGVAASIIQIADLGARVSIKLSTFYHKVKQANDNIQNLSTDVALTCTVLKQLGDNLQQDENVKLYSPDAFSVAKDIMGECDKVFRQIESAMEDDIISASPSASTSAVKHHVRKAAHKLHFVFLEPQLSVLQSNLDRLKSTMLLMLNVIIYAGQVRRKEAEVKQQGQKEIIEILVDEQKIKTKRYQQLTKAIEFVDPEESTRAASPYTSQDDAPFGVLALQDNTKNPDESIPEELTKYANLIKSLLTSVDEMKFALDSARYQRIKKGVLTIHDKELPPFLHQHGDSTCNKLFDGPLFERHESVEEEENRLLAVKNDVDGLRRRLNLEAALEHGEPIANILQGSDSVVERDDFRARARASMLGRTKDAVTYPFRKAGESLSRLVNRPKHKNVAAGVYMGISAESHRPPGPSVMGQVPGWEASDRPIFELDADQVPQRVDLPHPESWVEPSVVQSPIIGDDTLPEKDLTKENKKSNQDSVPVQEGVQEEVQDLILKWTTLDVSEIA